MEEIKIQGVRIHNLKNSNPTVPKRQQVVVPGTGGSGKSGFAFDKNKYLRSIGILIAKGTPEQLRDNPNSRTGRYLI